GVISPLITLTPDLNGLVTQTTVVKDMVINTGYLPANVTILGVATPLQINIPFQQETICPGVCPEDTVNETPFKIRSEEHTSELQSRFDLVCRLLLEKKKDTVWPIIAAHEPS